MNRVLIVGLGGFLGAALRYLISGASAKAWGNYFPIGTLLVNVLGGVIMGFIMEMSETTDMPDNLRLFLTTGILGGLTTFSTFSYETVSLASDGRYLAAGGNAALNLALALLGVVCGKFAARAVLMRISH